MDKAILGKVLGPQSLGLFLGVAMAGQGWAAGGVKIVEPRLSGACASGTELRVEQLGGEYFIKAQFNSSMTMQTDPGKKLTDTKRCVIDFKVALDRGLRFESFTFNVDGTFQLSNLGNARLTLSNTIANNPAIRNTIFYSLANGSKTFGDLQEGGVVGTMRADQFDPIYQRCGAELPFETSIFGTVWQPAEDQGVTQIDLDSGVSKTSAAPGGVCGPGNYCLGKLKVKQGC